MADNNEDESAFVELAIEQARLNVAQFANHVVVQTDPEGVCYIHFCQLQPPLVVGQPLSNASGITVKAEPVASIVMTQDKMATLVRVMQEQLERFRQREVGQRMEPPQ